LPTTTAQRKVMRHKSCRCDSIYTCDAVPVRLRITPLAAGATIWPPTDGRQTGRTFSVAVDRVAVSLFINSTRECFQRLSVLKFQSVVAANLLSPCRNLTRVAIHLEPSFIIHYVRFFIARSTERFSCILQLCRWKPERWKACLNCVISHFISNNSS
jgi:hypothetical protein